MSVASQPAKRFGVMGGLKLGLRNRWWPVFESNDLGAKPVGIKRLGEELVLWREASGTPHLFIDRCPHRGAAFSVGGSVDSNEIQCWYHGFRYNGDGQCTAVPLDGEDSALAPRVSITSYPVHEEAGMIWAYIGEVDLFPPPPIKLPEELRSDRWSWFLDRGIWNNNWLLVMDNLADPMHAVFLHFHSYTLSKGKKADRIKLIDLPDGFRAEREGQKGVNFDWSQFHDDTMAYFRLDIPYPKSAGPGGPMRVLPMATPIDEDWCVFYAYRLRQVQGWQRLLWRTLYKTWLGPKHHAVILQDQDILQSQRGLSSRLWEHLAQSDVGAVRLRRMINEAYWEQQQKYLAAASAGRRPSSGERVRAILSQSATPESAPVPTLAGPLR